jgi:hypothetical protein
MTSFNSEFLTSTTTTRISNKQKQRHDVILKAAPVKVNQEKEKSSSCDKLVVNISDVELSEQQRNVLSKGLNFGITPTYVPKFNIIKAIESSTYRLEPEKLSSFKAQIKRALDSHRIKQSNISESERQAIEALQENKNIVISKADKGNIVVVQNKKTTMIKC